MADRQRQIRRAALAGAGIAAGSAFAAAPADATDYPVTNDTDAAAPQAGSLRAAIAAANANPGADRVVFDSSLSGAINVTAGRLVVTEALEIVGNGQVSLDGYSNDPGGNPVGIMRTDPVVAGEEVEISGVGFVYGYSATGSGGAIINTDAKLTVEDSFFYGNVTATDTPNIGGGAIADGSGTADMTITGSGFYANSAPETLGGAIASTGPGGTITNSTVVGNEAGTNGGGLFAQSGWTLQNATLASNEAAVNGGGMFTNSGGAAPVLDNSIVADNVAGGLGPDIARPSSAPVDAAFSLLESTQTITLNSTVSGSNITGTDPGLPPSYYTQFPSLASPVVDKGRTAGGVTTDLRGAPRPFDSPDIANSAAAGADGADMGAFELTANQTSPADLAISVTDSPDPVTAGDPLTLTVGLSNSGPKNSTNAEADVFIYNASVTAPGCTVTSFSDGSAVNCVVPSIVSGASASRAITATPFPSATSVYGYAYVDGDQADPVYANNYDSFSTTVRARQPGIIVTPPPPPTPFDLKAAIKKCNKKFRGKAKAKQRKKCIAKARKQAKASASVRGEMGVGRHPWTERERPAGVSSESPGSFVRRLRAFGD